MALIYPVILCGGSGARLWPLSRGSMPKQFLNLFGGLSLFQQAVQRVAGSAFEKPLILTSNDYRFIAAQQLNQIDVEPIALFLEPQPKNTAPSILAAAKKLYDLDKNALMIAMPSDHYFIESEPFYDFIHEASILANSDRLVAIASSQKVQILVMGTSRKHTMLLIITVLKFCFPRKARYRHG